MTMVSIVYQTHNNYTNKQIANLLIADFTGQLKGWWDNYLSLEDKENKWAIAMTCETWKT